MNDKPSSFNTPERPIFSHKEVDALAMTLMTVAKELWVVKDRMRMLESVLDSKGIVASQEVDIYQPSEEQCDKLGGELAVFLANITDALQRR